MDIFISRFCLSIILGLILDLASLWRDGVSFKCTVSVLTAPVTHQDQDLQKNEISSSATPVRFCGPENLRFQDVSKSYWSGLMVVSQPLVAHGVGGQDIDDPVPNRLKPADRPRSPSAHPPSSTSCTSIPPLSLRAPPETASVRHEPLQDHWIAFS